MRPLIKNLLMAILPALFLSCSNVASTLSDTDCQNNISKANAHLNEYYFDGNEKNLNLALSIIDSLLILCPQYREQLVSLKITLLILLKEYDKGSEFVNTLKEEGFDKPYKRNCSNPLIHWTKFV